MPAVPTATDKSRPDHLHRWSITPPVILSLPQKKGRHRDVATACVPAAGIVGGRNGNLRRKMQPRHHASTMGECPYLPIKGRL
jgi:hypothetical protein